MGFRFLVAGDDGSIYAVTNDGNVLYYRDDARDGTPRWLNGGVSQVIGTGFQGFERLISGGDGILYAVTQDGRLLYYRDLARDGTENWAFGGAGQEIGSGFDGLRHLVNGGDGILYAVTSAGDLLYYRDLARDGTENWAFGGAGQPIGSGFGDFTHLLGGGDGVLYAVTAAGDLLYYRDLARDGTENWAFGAAGQVIGTGWANFTYLVAGGDGVFYAVTPDGFMLFYRDLARDGTEHWAFDGAARTLGAGWLPGAAAPTLVEGYSVPMAASPGDTLAFKVSSETPYTVTCLDLGVRQDGEVGTPMAPSFTRPAIVQPVGATASRDGCNWQTSFTLTVPRDWSTGVYCARLQPASGDAFYVPFVVRPSSGKRAPIAVLANLITWNAYNDWGGRSKYSSPPSARLSFERPAPLLNPEDHGQIDHLLRAEIWIMDWLRSAGFEFDVFPDTDFHDGIPDLDQYSALVLSTHPEYWTAAMLDHLVDYIDSGGCVFYLGGNGLFECVQLDPADGSLFMLDGDDNALRDRFYFRNLEPARPERAVLGVAYRYDAYMTFAPYQVLDPGHRFLAGTGLGAGDLIGASGINGGGASGWEMDTALAGVAAAGLVVSANGNDDRGDPPAGLTVLARGTNPGMGADMTCYDTPAGGFVFSTGSISFGGSLLVDPALQAILTNALNEALG